MNLRSKRKKPGEQREELEEDKNEDMCSTAVLAPTKNRNELKKKKKQKIDEISESFGTQDVVNILLGQYFSLHESPVSGHEECSIKIDKNNTTENLESVNKFEKTNSGKKAIMSNAIQEVDGFLEPNSEIRQREEGGFASINEKNPRNSMLEAGGEHDYEGFSQTHNIRLVKALSTNSREGRKGRGITTLSHITEDTNAVRKVIEFNTNGQPIGPNTNEFSSYLGILGRKMVPIIHESWPKVPKDLKEILWNSAQDKYVIDSERRKTVLSAIGERWKSFKAILTKVHIYPFKNQPQLLTCPPEKYKFITQEHWDIFVKSRLSEDFQAKSKLQAERRAKNIYNHRLGRKGYVGLVEELKQSLGTSVDKLDRCDLWKKARQNKKGLYVDDAVREKAELIDELTKQKKDGNLVIQVNDDILTLALGTPEHSGRVRAAGPFVTPAAYFNHPKRNSRKNVSELQQKVNEQADKILEVNQMIQELQAEYDVVPPQGLPILPSSENTVIPSSENTVSSTNNSDSRKHLTTPLVETRSCGSQDWSGCPNDDYHLESETDCQSMDKRNTKSDLPPVKLNSRIGKSKQCRLAVDLKANIVAHGTVFERVELNEKVHSVPLGEANTRVAVEYAISPNALLPVPVIGEMTMVKDAIGSCVAWPKDFVLTGVEEVVCQAAGEKYGPVQAFASLIDQIMSTDGISIAMQNGIFGEEVEAYHNKADLMYLCNMQEITGSCIITYIRVLYDNLVSSGEKYVFINPASISSARGPDASAIITKRLQNTKTDTFFFVPYNTRGHWVLMVIDSSSMDIYWLDPLQKPPSIDIKIYVTAGIKALQIDGKRRPNPTWHIVKCPKQPMDSQCGYYVMRYMRELVEERSLSISEKILQFAEKNSYSQDEIDEVRLDLIDFILTHM
ncbi:hypothetical protein FRX31_015326 [Thalictrum thalictroides]|uniref:Ubiquitin-like protease family profile domain-containing protein n=1 Tax=Thalictrum thalictroides TaxID=46969 RepID=A0A7J6WF95_THATH|nr:hypothetical protein FRX31_015326 [Thalictrum thalictroides]